jgi:hypothetical protein
VGQGCGLVGGKAKATADVCTIGHVTHMELQGGWGSCLGDGREGRAEIECNYTKREVGLPGEKNKLNHIKYLRR